MCGWISAPSHSFSPVCQVGYPKSDTSLQYLPLATYGMAAIPLPEETAVLRVAVAAGDEQERGNKYSEGERE